MVDMLAILTARANDNGQVQGSAAPSRRWLVYPAICISRGDFPKPGMIFCK